MQIAVGQTLHPPVMIYIYIHIYIYILSSPSTAPPSPPPLPPIPPPPAVWLGNVGVGVESLTVAARLPVSRRRVLKIGVVGLSLPRPLLFLSLFAFRAQQPLQEDGKSRPHTSEPGRAGHSVRGSRSAG